MKADDVLSHLKSTVAHVEFSLRVRSALTGVRLIDETDDETFDRMMRLAKKVICTECRGYRRLMISGRTCPNCDGSGERQIK